MNLVRRSLLAGTVAVITTGTAFAENISVWSSTTVEQHNGEQPIIHQEFFSNQPLADQQISTFVSTDPQTEQQMIFQTGYAPVLYQAQPVGATTTSSEYRQVTSVSATTRSEDHWNPQIWQSSVTGMFDMQMFFNDLFGRLGMVAPVISRPADQSVHLMIYLNGFQQMPSVNTPGYGVAHLMLDGHQLKYWIDVQNLTSPVSGAHFHRASAGNNSPAVFEIPFNGSHAEGVWNLSDQELNDIRAGNMYLNVHTRQFPDGEVRGQL